MYDDGPSFVVIAVVVTLVAYFIYLLATADGHIEGRRLYTFRQARKWQCSKENPHFHFGGLRHVWDDSLLNFLFVGSIGSGKTTLLRLLAQEFLSSIQEENDRRGFVYDPTGNMISTLAGMGLTCPVVSLHPFDRRGVAWDIASDITTPGDALQLAVSVIPQEKGGNAQFYSNAASQIIKAVIEAFQELAPENWLLSDIILATRTKQRLERILALSNCNKHLLANYFGNSEVGWGILSTIQAGLSSYSAIAASWSNSRRISLKHWANGKTPYILVMGQNQESKKALDSVNRLIFSKMKQVLLNQSDSETRRTFVFLDEVREAAFEGLSDLYTRGRAKGVSITSGFQSIEGLREAYGNHPAMEITGQNLQIALLRSSESMTAEWESKLVGDQKFWREVVSTTSSFNHGNSTTRQNIIVTEPAVLPSTFMSLPRTNKENGLTGLFISPSIGAWWQTYPGHELFSKLLKPSNPEIPNFIAKDQELLKLEEWTSADLLRLSLPSDLLDDEDGTKKKTKPDDPSGPRIVGQDWKPSF